MHTEKALLVCILMKESKMLFIQYFHEDELLIVGGKQYKATCRVRNELNRWRKINQIAKTYPLEGKRQPYYPRKFPTGIWEVKPPIWTDDVDYAPVKIPTSAVRKVMVWDVSGNQYSQMSGEVQDDAFYHLHFAKDSTTTLGCIRLDSVEDATEIAKLVEDYIKKKDKVWLEVCVKRG